MYVTLYTRKNCPYSHSVHIALEEKRMQFRVIELDINKDKKKIFSLHPEGLLPILKERDNLIHDPEVIMLYIDERYPFPSLLPNYPVERARTRLAMIRIDRECYSILNYIMSGMEEDKIKEAKIALIDTFKAIEPIFSENEFFMSDTMTLADCSLASLLYIIPDYGIPLDRKLGAISRYAQFIFTRHSFQRTLPIRMQNNYKKN